MSSGNTPGRIRHEIYQHFIENAAPPSVGALARSLELPTVTVENGLRELEAAREIALLPGTTQVWMAHPFSSAATQYPVEARGNHYWGSCAWDALGIAALLDADSVTVTHCPDCGAEMDFVVHEGAIAEVTYGPQRTPVPLDEVVVHFSVPARDFWDDIGFT
jgi:hypothetical protein